MYFKSIVASFFALGAICAAASPAPVVEKRQDISSVLAIIETLQSSTGSILPQLDSLADSESSTESDFEPLIAELVSSLDTSSTQLNALGPVDQSGASQDEVATKVASIYSDIATTSNNVKTKKPQFYPLFPKFGLEAALIKLLFGLEIVLIGVLKLVAALLKVVSGLLSGLGWVLLLVALGL
ncbi:hypothetical protein DFP72DRAFT_121232 [Ephemerocybe angulata]|uniref:Uncharacterized protein n=1 Tax=Ephemerocybe angulata TaxID=980116 RepID=A0A8H6MBL7_9AGAR|nr:hypothetical protein DFP72DRAFT_121232 [Tulosesus angulatus]